MCIGLLLPAVTARAASDGVNAMLLQGPSDFKLTILLDEQPVIKFSFIIRLIGTFFVLPVRSKALFRNFIHAL